MGQTIEQPSALNTAIDIKIVAWRFVRGAVATALAQTIILQVDWNDPETAIRTLVAAFVSGLLLALSKSLRDASDNQVVQKLPV